MPLRIVWYIGSVPVFGLQTSRNKLSKAVSSKLVVANCSTPSEVALVEFADELNNRISGVQGEANLTRDIVSPDH